MFMLLVNICFFSACSILHLKDKNRKGKELVNVGGDLRSLCLDCGFCVEVVAKTVLEIGESNFDVKQFNKQFAKRNFWISTGCKRIG